MSIGRETKDPAATRTVGFDWSNDLASGDTISASSWAFETAEGLTTTALTNVASDYDDDSTTLRFSGGVLGASYYLVNTVTTANGDTLKKRLLVDIEKE